MEIKAGWKTSEFWLAILTALIPILNKYLELNIDPAIWLPVVAIILTYIFGRSWIKARNSK